MDTNESMHRLADLSIGLVPKAMIALVLLGKKPCMELDVYTHNTSDNILTKALQQMGLVVLPASIRSKNKKHVATFCISREMCLANMLTEVIHLREETPTMKCRDLYHSLYGTLMGYPLSAIDGFISNNTLSEESDEYPKKLKGNLLVQFKLSNNNWKEEIGVIIEWERVLEKYAQPILRQLYEAC